jgi:hypothetical protein
MREARRSDPLPASAWDAFEERVRRHVRVRDDFVRISFSRIASTSDRQIAEAVESYKREAAIVDARLVREVTLQQQATALSDLCDRLRGDTGIRLETGQSVADEKVTIFCEKLPLRDVMRQLSRPFGYTWLRSGKTGEYRYELVQDLRSQLLEEELRNRDRNAALLALEKEIERFRPYLSLSPDEALAKAKTAPAAEKPLLEKLAGVGWGPIQMYFRLSPQQLAALRAGQFVFFSEEPGQGQFLAGVPVAGWYPVPKEIARGVLQCNRTWRIIGNEENGFYGTYAGTGETPDPQSLPLTAVPAVRAQMYVNLSQSELGQFTLGGSSGFFTPATPGKARSNLFQGASPYAVGRSAGDGSSESGAVNSQLARDPTLRRRVSVQPRPSCNLAASLPQGREEASEKRGEVQEPKVTIADALESLHHATGLPIVADFYTRLFKPEAVSVRNQSLFDALNTLTQAMRLRWNNEGGWLQFCSTTYYHDRLTEVPNRLLSRWAAARRQQQMLTLDQVVEIGQLTDDQLDGAEMREGAVQCWGLKEWRLLGDGYLRTQVRYLAEFTPAQRQETMSAAGLPFTRMSLAQQQKFITFALSGQPLQSLDELAGATLRVDYTQPGWYQWLKPGDFRSQRWAVTVDPGEKGRRVLMPPVRERTREAALEAARRLFPPVTEAMLEAWRPYAPDITAEKLLPQPDQIAPSELDLVIVYIPGTSTAHRVQWWRPGQQLSAG